MLPILIVDDSREDSALARRVLLQCGVQNPVRIMHSGQECIDFFIRGGDEPEWPLPCVVFLDLMMNPVSGVEVLRRLRDKASAHGSIFVMLSGASDYSLVRDGYQLGAATFVVKPLTCEEVLRTFKNLRGVALKPQSDGYEVVCTARDNEAGMHERPSLVA
jgi:CheY-like chemotaxis protein